MRSFTDITRKWQVKLTAAPAATAVATSCRYWTMPDVIASPPVSAFLPDEVVAKYLTRDEDGDTHFQSTPLSFLEKNRCRVYEHRPETCRSYPTSTKRISSSA